METYEEEFLREDEWQMIEILTELHNIKETMVEANMGFFYHSSPVLTLYQVKDTAYIILVGWRHLCNIPIFYCLLFSILVWDICSS